MATGRPRQFDPETALQQAACLFRRKGYGATSLNDLTEAMGINRPSLYAAFGNKDALFLAVVRRYLAQLDAVSTQAFAAPTAQEAVRQMVHGIIDLVARADAPPACLAQIGLFTAAEASAEVIAELAATRRASQARLTERLTGEWDAPDLRAAAIIALTQGLAGQAYDGTPAAELHRLADLLLEGVFAPAPSKNPAPK